MRQLHSDLECLGQPERRACPDSERCSGAEEGAITEGFLEGAAFNVGLCSDHASSSRPPSFLRSGKEAPDAHTSGQGLLGNDFCLLGPRWALRVKVKGEVVGLC